MHILRQNCWNAVSQMSLFSSKDTSWVSQNKLRDVKGYITHMYFLRDQLELRSPQSVPWKLCPPLLSPGQSPEDFGVLSEWPETLAPALYSLHSDCEGKKVQIE